MTPLERRFYASLDRPELDEPPTKWQRQPMTWRASEQLPLVSAFQSLNWQLLTPSADGMDLAPLQKAAPKVQSAAHAVNESAGRLEEINTNELLPQVAGPLIEAREKLSSLEQNLNTAADAAWLAPNMLGADGPRRYLLLMQNNAEARATGGIPGALAVLNVDEAS